MGQMHNQGRLFLADYKAQEVTVQRAAVSKPGRAGAGLKIFTEMHAAETF
jgi:hypothetical protein